MNAAIQLKARTDLTLPFKWRDSAGLYHNIEDMQTRHLFYTLRMIWNHTMPEEARSESYNRYVFGPTYTQEYMVDAIRAICPELFKRNNLVAVWRDELQRMIDYFNETKLLGPSI